MSLIYEREVRHFESASEWNFYLRALHCKPEYREKTGVPSEKKPDNQSENHYHLLQVKIHRPNGRVRTPALLTNTGDTFARSERAG